jgi:hypothetical protein
MRRHIGLLLAAACTALGSFTLLGPPAFAAEDCAQVGTSSGTNGTAYTCSYTQLSNPWPGVPGSPASPPFCSPCYTWAIQSNGQPGEVPASSTITNSNGVKWGDDVTKAMNDWSAQPYRQPWVYYCSCSQIEIDIAWADLGSGNVCGQAQVTSADSNNLLIHVQVRLNDDANKYWWDGPPQQSGGCDAIATAYHELGHAIGTLGHASYEGDAMYWHGGSDQIGGDDQQGLLAIYGAYQSSGSGCGAHCNSSCIGTVQQALCATSGLSGYWQKAWLMSQGISAPNPVSIITPTQCVQYEYSYYPWAQCMAYYEHPY